MIPEVAAFTRWIERAPAGEQVDYHNGFLPIDRTASAAVGAIANVAWRGYVEGKLELVQRRYGDGDYEYIAIRKRRSA